MGLAISGGREMATVLRTLPQRFTRAVMMETLTAAAEPIRLRMGQLAPRAPGAPDIADHIGISPARKTDEQEYRVAVGPTRGFYYGYFLEFGTVHMGAQAFARPAFDEMAPASLRRLALDFWAVLAGRGLGGGRGESSGGGLQ